MSWHVPCSSKSRIRRRRARRRLLMTIPPDGPVVAQGGICMFTWFFLVISGVDFHAWSELIGRNTGGIEDEIEPIS